MPCKSTKSKLKDTLDKVFSEYIRLRDVREDGTFICISCNNGFPYEVSDCGHYISREHMSTRFKMKIIVMLNVLPVIVTIAETLKDIDEDL